MVDKKIPEDFKLTKRERHMFELEFLNSFSDYITNTQMNYYSKYDKESGEMIDTIDVINNSTKDINSFLQGNVIKYITRYGSKNGFNRKDLYKAMHYIMYSAFFLEDAEAEKKMYMLEENKDAFI